jgi:ferredoxin
MEINLEGRAPVEGAVVAGYVTVTIVDTGETYRCRTEESLLEGMRRLGKRGIPVGCRAGGCSVCKIRVVSGAYRQFRPMSREYISEDDLAHDRVLACCVRPQEDVSVQVIGKLQKNINRPCAKSLERLAGSTTREN